MQLEVPLLFAFLDMAGRDRERERAMPLLVFVQLQAWGKRSAGPGLPLFVLLPVGVGVETQKDPFSLDQQYAQSLGYVGKVGKPSQVGRLSFFRRGLHWLLN